MSINPHEDPFLEEVLGLFALEAQEWINQGKTALLELERGPSPDREAKLYETIICGVTNLGGSAATVELPALEKLAFALVPLLQAMGTHKGHTSPEQITVLREGLDAIIASVQHLAETKTGEVPGLSEILRKLAEAALLPPRPDRVSSAAAVVVSSQPSSAHVPIPPAAVNIMEALSDLQRTHAESSQFPRHMADALIRKARAANEGRGDHLIDAPSIIHIMEELDAVDQRFLEDFRVRLPTITAVLSDLKAGRVEELRADSRLETALREIHAMQDAARALEAKPIMLFFHGLHTFLSVLGKKGVTILPQRFDAVQSRLHRALDMAQQWVDIGREERASIQKVACH